jgi:hypothetical protein
MLRRTLLLAALLAPLTALGQAISITPSGPYTKAQCESTTNDVVLNWSLPAGTNLPTGSTYRIVVATSSGCDETSSALVVASGIEPDKTGSDITGATNQRYPRVGSATGTLTVNTFATKASVTCANNPTMYTCVQLMEGTTVRAKTDILQLQVLDGPPATPVNVTVSPGDAALNVAWLEGATGTVPTDHYVAQAYTLLCDPAAAATPESCLGVLVSQGTTAAKSIRLSGLTIGTEYGVVVYAFSATGTPSTASAIATGTPIVVFDYWDKYKAMGGLEEGGCASGSAGPLSLLAVAGLLRALRRRS